MHLGRRGTHVFSEYNQKKSRALGRPRRRRHNYIKPTLQKQGIRVWSRLISIKTGTIGGYSALKQGQLEESF